MRIEIYHNTVTDLFNYFQKHKKDLAFNVQIKPKDRTKNLLATMNQKEYHVAVKEFRLVEFRHKVELHMDNDILRVWVGERKYQVAVDFLREKRKSLMQRIKREEATFQRSHSSRNGYHSYSFDHTYVDIELDYDKVIQNFDILEHEIENVLRDIVTTDIHKILSGAMTSEELAFSSPKRAFESESDDLTFHIGEDHDVDVNLRFRERI